MADGPGILRFGDFEIKALELISSTGAIYNLYTSFSELSIFEDIYTSALSGHIFVTDSNDMSGTMDIHGGEFLHIILDKPSLGEPIEEFFRVYKISNKVVKNKNSTAFVMHFVTEDQFVSNQYKISRAFTGPADTSVLSILRNDLNVNVRKLKLSNFESAFGETNVVIPYMHPFQAIQYFASRATNKNGSFYFFYENRDGYNFKSLETILNGQVYKTYSLTPKVLDAPRPEVSASSINEIIINQNYDTLTTMSTGGFAGRMRNLNVTRRTYTENDLNITNRHSYPALGKGFPVNNLTNRKGDSLLTTFQSFEKYSVSTTANLDLDDFPNNSEQFIFRSMEHSLLHNFRATVTIPGDPFIKVGDIIFINLPKFAQSITGDQKLDEFYSGKMLVMGVRHTVTPAAHTTYLEVVKDAVEGTLSDASNGALLLKAKK
jgi:hypothetical protein